MVVRPSFTKAYWIFNPRRPWMHRSRSDTNSLPQWGNSWVPIRFEMNLQFASLRQIHAAIEHMERGDFERATTLADAAKCMLADVG